MTEKKLCTCCKEFKSVSEFYKQGARLESICKACKKEKRSKRAKILLPNADDSIVFSSSQLVEPKAEVPNGPKSYEDIGLTKNEFMEVVEFLKEIIRLDQKEV